MEEKKNKTSCNIVIIIILMLMVLGLGGYIFYDKVMTKSNDVNESNNDGNSTIAEPVETKPVALDINSTEVTKLLDKVTVNNSNNACIYNTVVKGLLNHVGEYKVDSMTSLEKFDLVYHKYKPLITKTNNNDKTLYSLEESKLKSEYENIFGPNTYKQTDTIRFTSLGDDAVLTYNSTNKTYEFEQTGGMGGTCENVNEKVVSATKNSDTIQLLMQYAPTDGDLTNVQYTFKLNTNGEYYYYSSEGIK